MRLEKDYIEKFEKEQKELEAFTDQPKELTEKDYKNLELIQQIGDAHNAQFTCIENVRSRRFWTQIVYPTMCELAEICGGKVTLEIYEERLTGKLTYLGHPLILNNIYSKHLDCFWYMVGNCEDISIRTKDGLIELQFMFRLYDKERVRDNGKQIRNLKRQLYSREYLMRMFDEME